MRPKISVVVPVYNVEKYLKRCIDSILSQTFTDFELILIDDGSPDNCPKICDEYALNDHRIRVVHQRNSGVSTARNVGLSKVLGEWTLFIDSDDWIDKDYFKEINNIIKNNKIIDLIVFDWIEENINICETKKPIVGENGFECTDSMFYNTNPAFLWNKCFRTSLLKKNNITFVEKLTMWEDMYFMTMVYHCCRTVYYSTNAFYHYIKYNIKSISYLLSEEQFRSMFLSLELIGEYIEHFSEYEDIQISYTYLVGWTKLLYLKSIKNIKNIFFSKQERVILIKNSNKFNLLNKILIYFIYKENNLVIKLILKLKK